MHALTVCAPTRHCAKVALCNAAVTQLLRRSCNCIAEQPAPGLAPGTCKPPYYGPQYGDALGMRQEHHA